MVVHLRLGLALGAGEEGGADEAHRGIYKGCTFCAAICEAKREAQGPGHARRMTRKPIRKPSGGRSTFANRALLSESRVPCGKLRAGLSQAEVRGA